MNSAGQVRLTLALSIIVAALVIGALLRTKVTEFPSEGFRPGQKLVLTEGNDSSPLGLANFKTGFASVIDPDLPAVVNISSSKTVKQNPVPNIFNDPFFQQFFGDNGPSSPTPQSGREISLGSGVIVNSSGYIVTNNHVVSGASDVEVFMRDRRQFKATVVGTDDRADVAVLKIDASGLPFLSLGDSKNLKVGDLVFAIGDPFGVGETATAGIVSATGRALGGALEHYEDFIQTDAAINPGNSGGALIDLHGYLVGINTAIISGEGGGNEGVGFAIPIDLARNVMEQLVERGKVIRGYLGVTVQSVSSDMAKAFGLPQGGGALVSDVAPNSPASKAGIERGDIVRELNGQAVNSPDDLSVRASEMPPGTVVRLQIFRKGQMRTIDVTLGDEPTRTSQSGSTGQAPTASLQGLEVQNLTPDLARQLKLSPRTTGVVISGVDPASPAAAAGLQLGDVIQQVNHKSVDNLDQFRQIMAQAGNNPVLVLVDRMGVTGFSVLQPQ